MAPQPWIRVSVWSKSIGIMVFRQLTIWPLRNSSDKVANLSPISPTTTRRKSRSSYKSSTLHKAIWITNKRLLNSSKFGKLQSWRISRRPGRMLSKHYRVTKPTCARSLRTGLREVTRLRCSSTRSISRTQHHVTWQAATIEPQLPKKCSKQRYVKGLAVLSCLLRKRSSP